MFLCNIFFFTIVIKVHVRHNLESEFTEKKFRILNKILHILIPGRMFAVTHVFPCEVSNKTI